MFARQNSVFAQARRANAVRPYDMHTKNMETKKQKTEAKINIEKTYDKYDFRCTRQSMEAKNKRRKSNINKESPVVFQPGIQA